MVHYDPLKCHSIAVAVEAHVVSLSGLDGLISGLSAVEDSMGRSEPQEGVDMSSLVLWSMRCVAIVFARWRLTQWR